MDLDIHTSWVALAVLEHLPQPFVLVDHEGVVLTTNPLAQALVGESADAMRGAPLKRFLPHPEGRSGDPGWRPCEGGIAVAVHREHGAFPVEVLSTRFEVEGARVCALLLRDLRPERNARARLQQWEDCFLHAGWGVVISSVDGNRLELMNPAFAQMHGSTVEELRGCPLIDLFAPRVRDQVQRRIALGDTQGHYRYESVHLRRDGAEFPVLIDVTVVHDDSGRPLHRVVNVQDISELRRGEEALQRAKRFFEATFESAAVGMAVLGADGRVQRVNAALCALLASGAHDVVGSCLGGWMLGDSHERFVAAWEQLQGGRGEGIEHLEASMRGENRRQHWVALALARVPAMNGNETQFIVQALDITERRQAELALGESRQELRALAAYDDALIEEERKHIAREVHDELGQLLTALRMDLSLLRPALQSDPASLTQLDKMREMIDRTLTVVRHVASNLRPAALDLGLVAALEWLTEDFGLRWEIPCELRVRGDGFQLEDTVSTALFRVVQESLTNVARHAGAQHVEVRLARTGHQLVLEIEDDGCGFDPAELRMRKRKGFGLLGMQERMLKIGGTLEVHSAPGGTRVHLQLPLP